MDSVYYTSMSHRLASAAPEGEMVYWDYKAVHPDK